MLPVDRIVRELKVTLEGLKRGITEIAMDVDENMQIMKLSLQISDLEKKVEKAFIQLGQMTYRLDEASTSELTTHPEFVSVFSGIQDLKQQIFNLEKQVEGLRDDLLKERLSELRVNLRKKGGIIEELALLPGSPWTGRKIADLALDPQVILIALIREGEMSYPQRETILLEGDRLYLIGPRQAVYQAIEGSRPQPKIAPLSSSSH